MINYPSMGWYVSFHSISFPSEWGRVLWLSKEEAIVRGFHSISFPSEWGRLSQKWRIWGEKVVSIQLVSPASGDKTS